MHNYVLCDSMISYMPRNLGSTIGLQEPFFHILAIEEPPSLAARQILTSYRRRCLDTNSVKKTLARLQDFPRPGRKTLGRKLVDKWNSTVWTETTWNNSLNNIFWLVNDPWLIPESAILAWFANWLLSATATAVSLLLWWFQPAAIGSPADN